MEATEPAEVRRLLLWLSSKGSVSRREREATEGSEVHRLRLATMLLADDLEEAAQFGGTQYSLDSSRLGLTAGTSSDGIGLSWCSGP